MIKILASVLLAFIVVQFAQADPPFRPPNQQGLANLLFNSNDPQVAFECFGDYIAKLNTSSVVYKQNYTNCLQGAKYARLNVDKDMEPHKISLSISAENICSGWERCNGRNATLDVFLCHAKEGSSKAKEAFNLADRAEEYAKVMSARYRDIDMNQETCCKSAERKYAAEGSELYQKLKVCLKGKKFPLFPRIEGASSIAPAEVKESE